MEQQTADLEEAKEGLEREIAELKENHAAEIASLNEQVQKLEEELEQSSVCLRCVTR